MKLYKMWLPDMDSPEFIAEADRQSLAAALSDKEADDLAFIDSLHELTSDE